MAGLKKSSIGKLDFDLSLRRVLSDIRTDFIFAPHINAVYYYIPEVLKSVAERNLLDGSYCPQNPFTIEVIKASGFSRPGSILLPIDRLVYQGIVDYLAPIAEKLLDRRTVFSNLLLNRDKYGMMFKPPSICYNKFRHKLDTLCSRARLTHVIKADVASYFDRIYHHNLMNLIQGTDADSQIVSLLTNFLSLLTSKDSHGIIQGVYPSDFLGNLYLCSIDAKHKLRGIPAVRFVDDMYLFFDSEKAAQHHMIELSRWLRKEGLTLNEAKTAIYDVNDVIYEEREIDTLFALAKNQVKADASEEDYYYKITNWFGRDEEEGEGLSEGEIELEATKRLFDTIELNENARFKIAKFCLGVFAAAHDDYAVEYVLSTFEEQPHMAQIFSRYLGAVCQLQGIDRKHIESLATPRRKLYDYQLIWIYALLLRSDRASRSSAEVALGRLISRDGSEALRALCAIYVGKFGNSTQRRILKDHFDDESSSYVGAAILYSSNYFPIAERNSCLAAWSGRSELNSLVSAAVKKMSERQSQ